MVRQVLSVPASSSWSKHLFTLAGLYNSEKRGRLNYQTLETLPLLKVNKKVLDDNVTNLEVEGEDVQGDKGEGTNEGLEVRSSAKEDEVSKVDQDESETEDKDGVSDVSVENLCD